MDPCPILPTSSSFTTVLEFTPRTPAQLFPSFHPPPCPLNVHGFSPRPEDWLTNDDCFDRAWSFHTPGVDKAGSLEEATLGVVSLGLGAFEVKQGAQWGSKGGRKLKGKPPSCPPLFGVPFPHSLTQSWPEFTARPTGGQDGPGNPRSRRGGGGLRLEN